MYWCVHQKNLRQFQTAESFPHPLPVPWKFGGGSIPSATGTEEKDSWSLLIPRGFRLRRRNSCFPAPALLVLANGNYLYFSHAYYKNILCMWKRLLRGGWLEVTHQLPVRPQGWGGRCIFHILPVSAEVVSAGYSQQRTRSNSDVDKYQCFISLFNPRLCYFL